jgi:hypothetical protein
MIFLSVGGFPQRLSRPELTQHLFTCFSSPQKLHILLGTILYILFEKLSFIPGNLFHPASIMFPFSDLELERFGHPDLDDFVRRLYKYIGRHPSLGMEGGPLNIEKVGLVLISVLKFFSPTKALLPSELYQIGRFNDLIATYHLLADFVACARLECHPN